MSHVRRTWTGRSLLAAAIAVCVGCMAPLATAQDVPPPPAEGGSDIVGEEPQLSPEDVVEPTDNAPPESETIAPPEGEAVAPPEGETIVPPSPSETGEPALSEPAAPAQTEESPVSGDAPTQVEPAPVQPVIPSAAPDASPPASAIGGSAEAAQQLAPAPPSAPPPVAPSATPWSFALTAGYYYPRLGTLNRVLQDTSITFMQDPNFLLPRNTEFPFEQRNLAVDGIDGGPVYGVDTFYNTGGPHSFGLSFSSWRGETIGQDTISVLLRSNIEPVPAPRSARYNLILDRIFLEWRYHLFRTPEGKGLYVNAGLVGITVAYFTMDALVNVIDPNDQVNFASISSDESFGWSYTTRFGIGGDYPLTSWLSIGGRANYVVGNIRQMTVTRHFSAGFPQFPLSNPLQIRPGVPLPQLFFTPREGVTVSYATVTTTGDIQEEAGTQRALTLELSGWEGLIELAVHF